jgi:ribose 5-phosphate isomerase RpiB
MKVIDQLYDTIETSKIDELAAEQCASLSTQHPDFATLAARIIISNHQNFIIIICEFLILKFNMRVIIGTF